MEDDLPLIEISGADDSLLQSNADDNISFLTCSPFHLTRSKSPLPKSLGQMMRNQSAEKSSSSHKESMSVGKENVHSSEAAKLSMDPQTMKKKKKGFNLRKSIAWNRAFFTEEGVLDSEELSLLSGNHVEPCRNMLSSINEDEPSSSVRRSARKANNLRTAEKKPFKEASPRSEQKISSGGLSSKFGPSPTRSPAKPSPVKKDANKIGSKRSGCPRPMATSALKRPANVNMMTKGESQETKIPKTVVPKPNPLTVSAASKRAAGADKVKGNHAPPPVVNGQKRVGLQSSSRNINNQNNAKSGLPSRSVTAKSGIPSRSLTAKSSAEARKKLGSLPSESHSSADKFNTVNMGSKAIQEPEHISSVHGVINHNAKYTKISSLSQSGPSVGGSTQIAPPPMVKPSGLRLPSPSLQFFGSSKDSSSRSMLPRRGQTLSEVRNSRKMTSLKPAYGKPPATPVIQAVNVMTATGIDSGPCSSADCPLPSSTCTVSCENRKINLKENSEQQLDVKVACTSNTNERTDSQQYIHKDVEQQVEDQSYQNYGNRMLEHNGIEERVENDDDTKRDDQVSPKIEPSSGAELKQTAFESHHTNINQLAEDIQHQAPAENLGIYSESQSAPVNSHCIQGSSCLQDDQDCGIETGNKKSRELVDTTKPCSLESSHVVIQSQQPHGHEGTLKSEPSQEFCIVDNMNCDNVCSEEGYQSASEPGRSDKRVYSSDVLQAKDDFGSDEFSRQSNLRDAQVQCLDINPSPQNNKDFLNTSTADYQHVIDAMNDQPVLKPENPNPCLDISGSQLTSCWFQEESYSQEYQPENNLPNVKPNMPERTDASECSPEMKDVECLHFDDVAAVGYTEAKSKCGSGSLNQASEKSACNGPEIISLLTVPDTAVAANVCQNSAYLSIKELENPLPTSHLNSPGMDDAIDRESVKGRQGDLLVNMPNSISNLQPGENITSCDEGNLMLLSPSPGVLCNVSEEFTEQAKQMESCSVETDMDLEEDNQISETYDHPFPMKEKCLEDYSVVVADDIHDVSQVTKCAHDQYQPDQTEQSNDEGSVGVNSASKELLAGDKNVQPFDGSISFQNSSTNVGALGEEGHSPAVVEDKHEEPVESTEFKIPVFVDKEVSGSVEIKPSAENHETFFDKKLENDCCLGSQTTSMEFDLYSSSAAEVSLTENVAEGLRFLVKPDETSSGDIVQEAAISLLNSFSLTEPETGISQDGTTSETAMQDELNASSPIEAKGETYYLVTRRDALSLESKESRQDDLLVNIHNSIPNLQPGENTTSCDQGNIALLSPSPDVQCNVNEESTDHAKPIESCSDETDMELEEDNQVPETDLQLFSMKEKCSTDYSVVVADEMYDASHKNVGAFGEEGHSAVVEDKLEEPVESTEVKIPGFIGKEVSGSVEIKPSADYHETFFDKKLENDCCLGGQTTSMEFDLYSSSAAEVSLTENDSKALCLAEGSRFLVKPDETSSGDIVQEAEVSLLNSNSLTEAETGISQDGATSETAMQDELNASSPMEAKDEISYLETRPDTDQGNLRMDDVLDLESKESRQGDLLVNIHYSIPNLQPGERLTSCDQGNIVLLSPSPDVLRNVNEESTEHAKQIESSSDEIDMELEEDNQVPETDHHPFSMKERCSKDYSAVAADEIYEASPKNVIESAQVLYQLDKTEHSNEEGAAGVNSPVMDDAIALESVESGQGNLLVNVHNSIPNWQPGDDITSCDQSNLTLLSPSPGVLCNVNEESTVQANQIESCSLEVDMEIEEDNQIPETYHHPSSVEEKCFEDYSIAGVDDDAHDVNPKMVFESPPGSYQLDHTVQSDVEGSARVHSASKELLMGDKNVQPFDACNLFQNGSTNLGASAEEGQSSVIEDKTEEPVGNTESHIPDITGSVFVSSPSAAQTPRTENDSEALFLAEDSRFFVKPDQTSGEDIAQEAEFSLFDINTSTEAETGLSQNASTSETEMQNELNASSPIEVKDETSHPETSHEMKPANLVIKPPPSAVPFSDEWLAAFEAAGEEILTMKGGAVQNSPPDKSLPEPSPWSPVKKKNSQGIGPFDCTKFTNPNIPPPGSS